MTLACVRSAVGCTMLRCARSRDARPGAGRRADDTTILFAAFSYRRSVYRRQCAIMVFRCRVKAGTATHRVVLEDDVANWGSLQLAVAKALNSEQHRLEISLNKKVSHMVLALRLITQEDVHTGCDCCRRQHSPCGAVPVQWRHVVGAQHTGSCSTRGFIKRHATPAAGRGARAQRPDSTGL